MKYLDRLITIRLNTFKKKLIVLSLNFFVISLAVIATGLLLGEIKSNIKQDVKDKLHSKLLLTEKTLNLWLKDQEQDIKSIACSKDFNYLHNYSDTYDSLETLIFDAKGRLLSPSRFEKHLREIGLIRKGESSVSLIQLKDPGVDLAKGQIGDISYADLPLTFSVKKALNKHDGHDLSGNNRDYRGVKVFSAWKWNKKLGIGLCTKIDEKEAMGTYRMIEKFLIILIGAITFFSLVGIWIIYIVADKTNSSILKTKESLKETNDELNRAQSTIYEIQNLAHLGSLVFDFEAKTIKASKEVYNIWEIPYSRDKVDAGLFFERITAQDQNRVKELMDKAAQSGEKFDCIFSLKSGKDSPKTVQARGKVRKKEGGKIEFLGAVMDISGRIRDEKQMLKAKEKVEKASRAKSQFLANMSHEIRTPLNAILGIGYLVEKTQLNEKQRNYIKQIGISAYTLLEIINDILDFSKIEADKMKLESLPFGLDQLIFEVKGLFEGTAEEKNIRFSVKKDKEIPNGLIGDKLRIKQIIVNFLSNSFKFTDSGEVLLIFELLKLKEQSVFMKVSVKDTGTGIKKEDLKKLFKEFSQGDESITRNYGGTGLGLVICKKLLSMMNSDIQLETKEDKGSTFAFEVELPLAKDFKTDKDPESREKTRTVLKAPDGKNSILVVDDNEINRRIAQDILKDWNFEVDFAVNGKDALLKISQDNNSYNLVLMDIQMPIMDGITATKKIKEQKRFKELPVIALSADSISLEEQNIFDDSLLKPIEVKELVKKLGKYFGMVEVEDIKESTSKSSFDIELYGIDTDKGLQRLMGKKEEYKDLLLKFAKNQKETLETLNTLNTSEDKEELYKVLHALKGVSGNVGAVWLFDFIKELEAKGEVSKDEMEKICFELEKTTKDIEKRIKPEKSGGKEDIAQILKEMKKECEHFNPSALKLFQRIKSDLVEIYGEKKPLELESLLNEYSFSEAEIIIEEIINSFEG